jgi:hypothetical protein
MDGDVVGPLGVDDLVGIGVAVVLVGDVHVWPGMDVIADVDLKVSDDVAVPSDHAPVADPHHGIGDHLLAGHHAGRDAHVGADQGVPSDMDPPLAEHRPGWEGQAAPAPEGTEPAT